MRMKNNRKPITIILTITLLMTASALLIWPSLYEHQCKTRVYEDMESTLSSIESSNIRIIAVSGSEEEGFGYSAGASGVVFEKDNDTYYAMTAYHVVKESRAKYFIVATALTPTYDEYKKQKGITGHIPQKEYYDAMPLASVEYENEQSDLAIISFRFSEDLDAAEVAKDNPKKGDKIVAVGNPSNIEGHFIQTYGKILSEEEEEFRTNDGQLPSMVLKHSAYESPGSSGGAVFSEKMELVGINVGGGTDLFGRFRYGVMIPAEQIHRCISDWREQ